MKALQGGRSTVQLSIDPGSSQVPCKVSWNKARALACYVSACRPCCRCRNRWRHCSFQSEALWAGLLVPVILHVDNAHSPPSHAQGWWPSAICSLKNSRSSPRSVRGYSSSNSLQACSELAQHCMQPAGGEDRKTYKRGTLFRTLCVISICTWKSCTWSSTCATTPLPRPPPGSAASAMGSFALLAATWPVRRPA